MNNASRNPGLALTPSGREESWVLILLDKVGQLCCGGSSDALDYFELVSLSTAELSTVTAETLSLSYDDQDYVES